jgi:hypothetical protein
MGDCQFSRRTYGHLVCPQSDAVDDRAANLSRIFCYAGLLGFAFTAVAPVFWFTSIPLGGFDFEPNMISLFFMISGFSQALWLLIVFPPLQRRIGTAKVLRLCGAWWPVFILSLSLGNILLKAHWKATFWAISIPFQVLGSGVSMAFSEFTTL